MVNLNKHKLKTVQNIIIMYKYIYLNTHFYFIFIFSYQVQLGPEPHQLCEGGQRWVEVGGRE